MKLRGFEFEDQSWFPGIIRACMTEYLRFLFHAFGLYEPVLSLLKNALLKSNTREIIDLCSGSGGAMESIYTELKRSFSPDIRVTLTDLFPGLQSFRHLQAQSGGGISFVGTPVCCNVPSGLKGFRTIFSGIHHFRDEEVKVILKNAVKAKQGIGIFDGGNKNAGMILLILIIHPVLMFLFTPFIRPLRLSRLLFTYLIPVIPFCTIWDGIISILRLYSPDELLQMATETETRNYIWTSGKVKNKLGLSIAYLIGYPRTGNNK